MTAPHKALRTSRPDRPSRGFLLWRNLLSPLGVATLHGLLATVLYAPAIFLSQPLLMSTDNIRYVYPQFLLDVLALRIFDFPSWNQYIQAGVYLPASPYSIVYSPYIWLLSLVPSRHLLDGIAFLTIVHHVLAGVFCYLLCARFVPKRRWALLASIVYTSGGTLIYTQVVYHLFLTYSLLPLACYLVTGLHTRKSASSIILVSMALTAVLLCNQPTTAPLILLSVTIVFLLYYWRDLFSGRLGIRLISTFAGAMAITMLLIAIRYVPLFDAARDSPRYWLGAYWFPTVWQGSYVMIGAMVPELLGTRFQTPTETPGNLLGKSEYWAYIGIVPLFFLAAGAIYARAYRGLAAVALVILAFDMRIKPFADVGFLFLSPRYYPMMHRVSSPILAILVVAAGAKYCHDKFDISYARFLLFFSGFVAAAIAFFGVVYAVAFDTINIPRLICCLAFVLIAAVYLAQRFHAPWERCRFPLYWSAVALTVASLAAIFIWISGHQSSAEALSGGGTIGVSVLGYLLLSLSISWNRVAGRREGIWLAIIGLTLTVLLAVIAQRSGGALRQDATVEVRNGLAWLGGIKMLAGFGILAQLLTLRAASKLKGARFFCYTGFIVIVDLIPFSINYAKYFDTRYTPYENSLKSSLATPRAQARLEFLKAQGDLRAYRVNAANEMLGMGPRLFIAHIPYSLGVRSYGGFNSLENPWLLRLLERFDRTRTNMNYGAGTPDDYESPRLLDILGVRYDVRSDGELLERPAALPRFLVFSDYECLADRHAQLDRVASSSFDVQGRILLSECPSTAPVPGPSRKVAFEELSSGRIRVSGTGPGILFFGDAYHEGWHPYVNGRRVSSLRADYAFTAVELPSGPASVEWRFEPASFRVGWLVSLSGLVLLAAVAAVLAWSVIRHGSFGGFRAFRRRRVYGGWTFATTFGVIVLAFIGCRAADFDLSAGSEPKRKLEIVRIQGPSGGTPTGSAEHLLSDSHELNEFFESGRPFPQTLDIELDPSSKRSLKRYVLVTGNQGIQGNDSILRMPRAWTVSGSNDAASWAVVDRQDDPRPWNPNEERSYELSSPARYRYFRFVFTQSGPTPILRIYRLRLYAD